MGIRGKLLLASLTLLIVPWLGYQYIQNLESYLRTAHEEKLIDRVSIMAAVMSGQQQLFDNHATASTTGNTQSHLYIRPLQTAIQLDGYIDDWRHYQNREQPLGKSSGDLSVLQRTGHYNEFLYIVLRVKDDNVIYRSPKSLRLDRSDHLRISMLDSSGHFRRYQVTTITPGWVSAYLMPERHNNSDLLPLKPEPRIKGEWQYSNDGYTVELRIPFTMLGTKFAIAVADVDDAIKGDVKNIVASANTENADELGSITVPNPKMESLLNRLNRTNNQIWVTDTHQRVIGMADGLTEVIDDDLNEQQIQNSSSPFSILMKLFYRLTLKQPNDDFTDLLSSASRLDNPAVAAAVAGNPGIYWRTTEDEDINIITTAHPVYINENIVGTIAIEENSNSILILQNRVIEAMANMSILTFLLTVGVLLAFATRLSLRIHRLRNEVDASISDDGKVQSIKLHTKSGDEIGDLGRSFASMLQRLSQYNRYLETISSKLSHELRTPITIVRSSLDNLDQDKLDPKSITYVKRANEGITRLNSILTRMSEATHLEQTILHEKREIYCASKVIEACADGYRLAYPEQHFEYHCSDSAQPINIEGSPELLAQLMDKLVDNATDFARKDSAITLSIANTDNSLSITVHNQGPTLPDEMRASLFDSMVSVRQHKTDEPHLGLGLYIVRLITEFHDAKIEIQNTSSPEGVAFKLTIPLATT